MLDYFYLFFYQSFRFVLLLLSRKSQIRLMKSLAWLAYTVSRKHQRIINTNLDIAFNNTLTQEEKRKIGLSAFTNLVDTVFGILQRDAMTSAEVVSNVSFEGDEVVRKAQKEGKKIIFITGHQGNWELLSQAIAIHFGLTLVGVGRKLDSDVMDALLKKNRERFNVEMVYKNGAMKGCIKSLAEDKAVGILIDQALGKSQSIDVKFFSHDTSHTPIASILSRKFGIDLIPAFISTEDYQNYKVTIYPAIESLKTDNQESDLAILTQLQADAMELAIRTHPKEWFWMHKRWKGFVEYER